MTKEEFLEQYGTILITFVSYYKYSFTYEAHGTINLRLESIMAMQALEATYRNQLFPSMTVRQLDEEMPYYCALLDGKLIGDWRDDVFG